MSLYYMACKRTQTEKALHPPSDHPSDEESKPPVPKKRKMTGTKKSGQSKNKKSGKGKNNNTPQRGILNMPLDSDEEKPAGKPLIKVQYVYVHEHFK